VGLLCGIGRVLWMVGRSVVGGLWAQLLNIESREFVWSVVGGGCWEDGGETSRWGYLYILRFLFPFIMLTSESHR
jgi:hypothetical protein